MTDLGKVVPNEIRARLAEVLGDELTKVVTTVLEALEANSDRYISCVNCKHRSIYTGPDWNTRLKAAEALIEAGIGRTKPTEPEPEPTGLDKAVSTLNTTERAALARTLSSRYPGLAAQISALSQAEPPRAPITRSSLRSGS